MLADKEKINVLVTAIKQTLAKNEVDVPMLPEVAANVLRLTQDPDSDASALANLIQGDQTLAAHVMKIANSAAYSPNGSIVSLQQALARLGMQNITEIALAASVNSSLFHTPGFEHYVSYIIRCSLASALWSKEAARACRKNVEAAFLAALLNDIGRPVVIQMALSEADKRHIQLTIEELQEIENSTKRDVGNLVANSWEMPKAVKDVISYYDNYMEPHANQQQTMIVVGGTLIGHHFCCDQSIEVCATLEELKQHPVFAQINLYEDEIEQLMEKKPAVDSAMEAINQ